MTDPCPPGPPRLALAGQCSVSAVARGATLAALRCHGLRLHQGGKWLSAPLQASDDPAALRVQDLVVIAVKGPALGRGGRAHRATGARHAGAAGDEWGAVVVGVGVAAPGAEPLHNIDPGGRIAAALPLARVIGCVVHARISTAAPGQVVHQMGQGLIIGQAWGDAAGAERVPAPRLLALAGWLRQAGFETTVSADVRRDIWHKLWGNMTMNPITAITGATVDRVLDDPLTRGFCTAAKREAAAVGEHIGCAIEQTPEDRHQITRRLGAFQTSMLTCRPAAPSSWMRW